MAKKPSYVKQEGCIGDVVENAYSAIAELQSEVQETVDGASGTNRENTSRIQTLTETADALGNHVDAPIVPDSLTERRVSWQEHKMKRRGLSRAKQVDNIVASLQAVVDDLGELEGEDDGAAQELSNVLEETIGELEGVEFPGWAG